MTHVTKHLSPNGALRLGQLSRLISGLAIALAELRALNSRPVRGGAEPTGAPAW
ncbi:hypothetical protein [Micromonospora sp. 15K316]|uniref:hypothetical protein n=1 Tax=Micromonospora sp. 15K316 TaxID=2530376 RepID=UPI00140474DD|nr:hypothetical protein [Micromonospora sp. 15K316]